MQLELLLVALVLAFGPLNFFFFQRSAFSTFVDYEGMSQMADISILLYNCIYFRNYCFSFLISNIYFGQRYD